MKEKKKKNWSVYPLLADYERGKGQKKGTLKNWVGNRKRRKDKRRKDKRRRRKRRRRIIKRLQACTRTNYTTSFPLKQRFVKTP